MFKLKFLITKTAKATTTTKITSKEKHFQFFSGKQIIVCQDVAIKSRLSRLWDGILTSKLEEDDEQKIRQTLCTEMI